MDMEFISTKEMTNENAPEGQVLVQYLEPSWGKWSVEYAIGYFDNPKDYEKTEDESDFGWKHWFTDRNINVLAYCKLPETIETPLTKIAQKTIYEKFGTYTPNLGCAGELDIKNI